MHRRVVGIHRRWKARIYDAPFANLNIDDFRQPVVDGEGRIHETGEKIATGGAHNGGTDVRGTFGLVGAAGEVEYQAVPFFLDPYLNANRLVEIDAVAVHEAFAFADPVRPRGDFAPNFRFGHREELLIRSEDGFLAVALHHFLKALFAEARRSDLPAQVADHELRRAAVAS